jgi:hypothetical protein
MREITYTITTKKGPGAQSAAGAQESGYEVHKHNRAAEQ